MDVVTLSLAKQYADEKANEIVFDGYKNLTVKPGQEIQAPFTDLIGLNILDKASNRRMLRTPKDRPVGISGTLLIKPNEFLIAYDTNEGILDKYALLISGSAMYNLCPTFFYDMSAYQAIMYLYEETSDTMGLGLVLQPGWYAVNTSTFANEPFDLESHPIVINDNELLECAEADAIDYLKEIFPTVEEITYTVTAENLMDISGETGVSFAKVSRIPTDLEGTYNAMAWIAVFRRLTSFVIRENTIVFDTTNTIKDDNSSITISYHVLKPLDPKFVPGVVLPVVDCGVYYSREGVAIPDERSQALLNSIRQEMLPIFCHIKYTEGTGDDEVVSDGYLSLIMTPEMSSEGEKRYLGTMVMSYAANTGVDFATNIGILAEMEPGVWAFGIVGSEV